MPTPRRVRVERGSSLRAFRVHAFAAAVLAAVTASSSVAEAAPLKLEDAVSLALTRNERSKIASLDVVVAEAGVSRARAAFLPVVSLGGTETLRPVNQPAKGFPDNASTGSLTVNQPILNAGAFPLYSQSKRLLEAQIDQSKEDTRQLTYDAAHAFLQMIQAQATLKAAERRLDFAKASVDDTSQRVAAGLNGVNDVTRAQLDVNTSQREVVTDQGLVDRSAIALEFLMNAPVQDSLVAPDNILSAAKAKPPSLEQLVSLAMNRRLDVAASKARVEAAKDFADEPSLRFVPVLGASAAVRVNQSKNGLGNYFDETLTFTLTWTIWDAGVRSADAKSREAQADIAQLDLDANKRAVDAAVRTAISELTSSQAAFQVAQDVVDTAKKSADETAELYRDGTARAIELVDANDSLFEAEVNFSVAEYALVQAYLDLRNAIGIDAIGTELQ